MRNKKRFIIISNHSFNGHMRAKSIDNISKNRSKCEDKNASINIQCEQNTYDHSNHSMDMCM